uniref:Uncharacterized protein n=1 Tax=Trichogramma kaykai TaxID=54128 RepID=A0ABD2WCP5_9HYME
MPKFIAKKGKMKCVVLFAFLVLGCSAYSPYDYRYYRRQPVLNSRAYNSSVPLYPHTSVHPVVSRPHSLLHPGFSRPHLISQIQPSHIAPIYGSSHGGSFLVHRGSSVRGSRVVGSRAHYSLRGKREVDTEEYYQSANSVINVAPGSAATESLDIQPAKTQKN